MKIVDYINTDDIRKPVFRLDKLEKYNTIKKYSSILFFILFYSYCALSFWYYNSNLVYKVNAIKNNYVDISLVFFLVAFIYMVILSEFSMLQLFVRIMVVGVLIISYYIVEAPRVLVGWTIVLAVRINKDEFQKIVHRTWMFLLLFLMANISLYAMRITTSTQIYRDELLRWDWGMQHPNALGGLIFILCSFYIMDKFHDMKVMDYIFILFALIILWYGVNCRTAAMLLGLEFVFQIIGKLWGEKILNNKFMKYFLLLTYPIMMLISYFGARLYSPNNRFFALFDRILSSRLSYGNYFLGKYRFALFGQKIKMIYESVAAKKGVEPKILDNAYLRLYINFGAVETIIFIAINTAIIWWGIKQKRIEVVIIMVILALGGICETYFLYAYFNMFMILFGLFRIPKLKEICLI